MSRYLGGVAWFVLYVALVGLPALTAVLVDPIDAPRRSMVELSVALGLLAYPLVMIQFALVSHLGASSRPFGTDALIAFHQYMGFLCLLLALLHPLLLNAHGLPWSAWNPAAGSMTTRSGAIATLAILVIVVTTVFRARLRLSYEWWQRVHLAMAIAAAAGIAIHAIAARGYSQAGQMRLLLLLYLGVFGSTVVNYRVVRPLRMQGRPWEIVSNREEGAGMRVLRVRPVGHRGFAFEPGQFAWLVTGAGAWSSQQHPLSIASSAERDPDGGVEFAIQAVGDWSSGVVPRLAPGTRVWLDGPFGAFTIDRKPAQGFVLIAGGSGIAPFRSMLLTMRDRGDRRHVVLIHAARDEARAAFAREIEALRGAINLDVVPVLEEPQPGWSGERGLVTGPLLGRYLPRHFRRYGYFLCGPPAMMDAVEALLVGHGVPPRAIDTERFDVV